MNLYIILKFKNNKTKITLKNTPLYILSKLLTKAFNFGWKMIYELFYVCTVAFVYRKA